MLLSTILDRVLLGGYEAAKAAAARQVIARYSRRNISIQNGCFIDEKALEVLREAGDKAMQNIRDWHPKIKTDR